MQKWLCMQRGYTTERAQVSTNRYDIVLLDGDKVVYIPISPGYYARSGADGGRIRVNGDRLCKNAILTKSYSTELTTGATEWTVPYSGFYEVIVNGAGGGAQGGAYEHHDGEEDNSVADVVGGNDGHGGEQIRATKKYFAGQRISVVIGIGGDNAREVHPDVGDTYTMRDGYAGGNTSFGDITAAGGIGEQRSGWGYKPPPLLIGSNELGGRGGTKHANPKWYVRHQPDFFETHAEDGSVLIKLLLDV